MKIIAHPAPKPLSKSAPKLGLLAAGLLAVLLILQMIGLNKVLPGLSEQFDGNDGLAIAVTATALIVEFAALPFLLRRKLSHLAGLLSGVAAVIAPLIWLLVVIWSIGEPDTTAAALQFGIAGCFDISWWLLVLNLLWVVFSLYIVRQLNIDKIWYDATGLKPRSQLKKEDHKK